MDFPYKEHEPLAKYTSYRIGGPARFFALPQKIDDLKAIAAFLKKEKIPYFVLGNGSNVLAPDEGFPGLVICTRDFNTELNFLDANTVLAGAGVLNSRLLRACAEKGLAGIEYLSGVPGNLGGAVFMNAGTATGWIEDVLLEVRGFSLLEETQTIHEKKSLRYSYREQHFLTKHEIICSALLRLKNEAPEEIKKNLAESVKKRKAAQPIDLPSCGSVFRNPESHNAWKLVAEAGLRGTRHGGARISEKHSNFIVNEGGATMADVLFLIQLAKEKVYAQKGIKLHEEVVQMLPQWL